MAIAILIVFKYMFNSLKGALIDLYLSYQWCKKYNYDIYVFTDITMIDDNHITGAINNKIVDYEIKFFFDDIEKKFFINNKISLILEIITILKQGVPDGKLIIYYSGHGVKDSMVMPNRELLPFIDFKNNILDVLDSYIEIFCILDCCNPNGLYLPYKFNHNTFTLSPSKIEFITQPFLLITSSNTDEKSIATNHGSLFTNSLFKLLSDEKSRLRNLSKLINNLKSSIKNFHSGYYQTVSVYSSYIIHPILWTWIGSRKSYDIVSDLSLTVLTIRPLEKTPTTHYNAKFYFNPYDLLYP